MSRTTVAVAIAVLVGGTALWLVGIVAVGQGLEDVCFDDLESRPRYGAYQSRASLVATVRRVPTPGLLRRADRRSASPRGGRSIGVIVVFPVVYCLGAATLALYSIGPARGLLRGPRRRSSTAERLERAYDREAMIVALDVPNREAILRVLEECPEGLAGAAGDAAAGAVRPQRGGL